MANYHNSEMPPMVLRRLKPALLARPIQTHTHFHLAPRLNFTVAHTAAQTATLRVERILRTLAGERLIQREELVHRIVTQGVRQEEGRPSAPGQAVSPVPPTFARNVVPAVLLRSPAPQPAVLEVPAQQSTQRPWPQPAPMMALQPDLDRLSEHVIRTIDRRLQAHRERTGRV